MTAPVATITEVKEYGVLTATRLNVKEAGEHCYGVKYSHDGKFLAATFGNGVARVLDGKNYTQLQRTKLGGKCDDVPATGVKWREIPSDAAEEGVYELAVTSTGGGCFGFCFDISDPSGCFLDKLWKLPEEGNETNCCDYSPDGKWLATAGSDRVVRLYDPVKKKCVQTLSQGHDESGHSRPAHTNRIFSVAWSTPNFFLTGGWECPVQIWDIRTGKAERQLMGPAVSSDSIEIMATTQHVMIGSNRNNKQITVFDYMTGREINAESEKYSAGFGKATLSQIRYDPSIGAIWAVAQKPEALIYMDAESGEVKGMMDGVGTLLAIDVNHRAHPGRCLLGGFREGLWVVDLAGPAAAAEGDVRKEDA